MWKKKTPVSTESVKGEISPLKFLLVPDRLHFHHHVRQSEAFRWENPDHDSEVGVPASVRLRLHGLLRRQEQWRNESHGMIYIGVCSVRINYRTRPI